MNLHETAGSDTRATRKAPTLWAVGGGKGGVGKSLITSSIAISFARRGHRCAVIDLDLGAANLHSLLGVEAPRYTLSDFLNKKVTDLSEVLCSTPYANLQLISGARASLGMANPKHCQKEKLLRHIRALDFDHIFLDLSAGCAFNALDFFLAADHGIAVVTPERTSIENTQNFLKTAFFRSLRKVAQREPLRSAMMSVLSSGRVQSARDLIRGVAEVDAEQGRVLAHCAAAFSPMLVFNQLDSTAEQRECAEIVLACRHYLTAGVRECGALPRDQHVRDALRQGQHVLSLFPSASFSVAVDSLTRNLRRAARQRITVASHLTKETPAPPPSTVPTVPTEQDQDADRKQTQRPPTSPTPPASPPSMASTEQDQDADRKQTQRPPTSPTSPASPPSTVSVLGSDAHRKQAQRPQPDSDEPGAFLQACREQHQGTSLADIGRRPQIRSLGELAAAAGPSLQSRSGFAAPLRAQMIGAPLLKRRTS